MRKLITLIIIVVSIGCSNNKEKEKNNLPIVEKYKTTGVLERFDPALDNIISKDARAQIVAEGFEWSEGPLWIEKNKMLLFSDIPKNTVYKWTEEKGKEIYLIPSGYTGSIVRTGEMGSNGLILSPDGGLVLCQHGDRRMAKMDAPIENPAAKFITLADKYNNKRFSSPNDAVYNSAGDLFFTDPPYGLVTQNDTDPSKEISFNGVYKVKKNGQTILLVDSITRPNGIAFFPGEKQILIACSDPEKPNWYVYEVNGDVLSGGKIFYSTMGYDKSWNGLPDGLKIDKNGTVFATGPGGVYIFNSEGKKLGLLKLENATSNCALSADEKILYITNDMYILKFKMRD
jgi:gluconolactonase